MFTRVSTTFFHTQTHILSEDNTAAVPLHPSAFPQPPAPSASYPHPPPAPLTVHAVKEPLRAHCPGGTQLCPALPCPKPPALADGWSQPRCQLRPGAGCPHAHHSRSATNMLFAELHKLELDSLSVQCPYGALGYSWGRKAWCRQGQAQCSLVVSTVYSPKWGSNGARNKSSSIQDDTRTRTVTITMDKLQVQDSGVYWCALYNPNQRPAFIRIMEVRLSVDKSEYLLADLASPPWLSLPSPLCPSKKEPSTHITPCRANPGAPRATENY